MEFNPTYDTVHNEGCDLHYWYQGIGPLIVFIPGGNGHGRQFNALMAALSAQYTCATFDRRQMSASQVKVNKILSPPQQARDALAVIKALGFEKAIVFGSSLGGIIAFQLAIDYSEVVDHLICHEAPTSLLLPNASELWEWLLSLYEIYKTSGTSAAFVEFEKKFIGFGEDGVPATTSPEPENGVNFWENEFLIAGTYVPDLRRLVERKVSVGLMTAIRSRDAFYARTTLEQEKILGCLRAAVPGHHQGFEVETAEFAPAMLEMLGELESRRNSASSVLLS
jgi:pimeloyl-ACP methyl ester carboxylesterase